ncbi:MAG: class I SAM-dependent methyltransferase [Acidobacteriota bacterium]|nr:class I SAM-dependent methyltransferase [Acidobacteriota bacterium]
MPRLGMTDMFHDAVNRRGWPGRLYLIAFGTPHLGTFANGCYLRRVLRRRKYRAILDAGCGDGTFSFYAARKFPEAKVTGVDIGEQGTHGEEDTLHVCARVLNEMKLPNLSFRQIDLRQLPFENQFDLVFSFDVLEHIAENREVLANIYRALQPGGDFLLRIPTRVQKRILPERFTAEHAKWAEIEHVGQHYEMDTLLSDLRQIGYEAAQPSFTMGFWGKLSFELVEAARYYRIPEVLIFALTPVLKMFRFLDTVSSIRDGDGLLVLCRKPLNRHGQ